MTRWKARFNGGGVLVRVDATGGGALIGREKSSTRVDWLPQEEKRIVGRLWRDLRVGGRESSKFTTMKTVGSLSHAATARVVGFLPSFGRVAGMVDSGKLAGIEEAAVFRLV